MIVIPWFLPSYSEISSRLTFDFWVGLSQHDLLLFSDAEKTSYVLILQLCKVCLWVGSSTDDQRKQISQKTPQEFLLFAVSIQLHYKIVALNNVNSFSTRIAYIFVPKFFVASKMIHHSLTTKLISSPGALLSPINDVGLQRFLFVTDSHKRYMSDQVHWTRTRW